MKLEQMTDRLDLHLAEALPDLQLTGLSADSRAIAPGMLFAALPGEKTDGRSYIPQAVQNGASLILAPTGTQADIPVIESANPRRALAHMAAAFYGIQPRHVVAVTGTNGKSSTVDFCRQLWQACGVKAASLGTLGLMADDVPPEESLTTPDPVALHQNLARLARAGVDHLAMEASSHGLAQCRMDGVRLAAGAFLNLTRDHLDYHGDLRAYLEAKLRLFVELLPPQSRAVLNDNLPDVEEIEAMCVEAGLQPVLIGQSERAHLRIMALTPVPDGLELTLAFDGKTRALHLPLIGDFQAENALAAYVLAQAVQPDLKLSALETLKPVRGRMEQAFTQEDGTAGYVDYAHTPDALERVLKALRPHCRARLICIFGAGGNRDAGKRPMMGQVVAEYADMAIITDDNPRHEDPAAIRRDILAGCPQGIEIAGRDSAITAAVDMAQAGDIILLAGKGHEQGVLIGDQCVPFDDLDHLRQAARRKYGEDRA